MLRTNKSWGCADCRSKDASAGQLAIQEYFSLIDTQVTNKQLRAFCHIESPDTARRLLLKYDFLPTGDYKTRAYSLKK